jgi:xyloglucan-specific endo-beta-1,4-glucanase
MPDSNVVMIYVETFVLRIQPVGSQITTGTVVANHTWNLWKVSIYLALNSVPDSHRIFKGPNANWEVLSFVSAAGNLNSFNVDLNAFFSERIPIPMPLCIS